MPPASALGPGDVSPRHDAAWRAAWVDEEVPALDGLTPRKAAEDDRGRLLLEALLRQFEWDAAVAAGAGKRPVDVGALRAELGMERG